MPSRVLAQLGNRVQHALRAFTPDDADSLRKTARTFPMTEFYDVEKLLTSLGIGEAAGHRAVAERRPDAARRDAARSRPTRDAPFADDQFAALVAASPLTQKYGATVDRQSAYEMIQARIAAAQAAAQQAAAAQQPAAGQTAAPLPGAAPGTVTMTPAELRRAQQEAARQARDAEKAAERERRAEASAAKKAAQEQARAERERQRTINSAIRSTEHIATSRLGQDVIRGVFGTLFGKK